MTGLIPALAAGGVEVEDAVHVAVVGDAERRLPVGHRRLHQVLDPGGPVEHRELGVGVQVGERPCDQRAGTFLGVTSPLAAAVLHRVWTSYSGVIPTIARSGGDARGRRCRSVPGRRGPALRDRCPGRPTSRVGALGERALAHLVELGPGRHLLGHQGGLDPVEQALEPARPAGRGRPGARRRRVWPSRTGWRSGPARRPGRGRGPRPARGSTARRSRGGGRGWPRRAGPERTSSSSCLTIEPMRSSLAGCSMDSVGSVSSPAPSMVSTTPSASGRRAVARRADRRSRGGAGWIAPVGGAGVSGVSVSMVRCCHPGEGHQGDQHLVGGQGAVTALQPALPGVGRVDEGDRVRGGAGPRRPAGR